MALNFDALKAFVEQKLTQQSPSDRITGVELRASTDAIINMMESAFNATVQTEAIINSLAELDSATETSIRGVRISSGIAHPTLGTDFSVIIAQETSSTILQLSWSIIDQILTLASRRGVSDGSLWSEWTTTVIGGSDTWSIQEIDSAVTTSITAQKNIIYICDCTQAPITVLLPDPSVANINHEFDIGLRYNSHKITVTTESGIANIGSSTSTLIPTVGASVRFKSTGTRYDIISDSRNLFTEVVLTESRDFSDGDGIENNVIYKSVVTTGNELVHTLKEAQVHPGGIVLKATFSIEGDGNVIIRCPNCLIGDSNEQILNISGTSFSIIEANGTYSIQDDTRPKSPLSNIVTYALSTDSVIIDATTTLPYKNRSIDIAGVGVESEAGKQVNTSSPDWTLISSSITPSGLIVGEVGVGNINILTTIRKEAGVQDLKYQVRYYKWSEGVESLIATSNTVLIQNVVAQMYNLVALHDSFTVAVGDRIVVKTYGQRTSSTGTPTLYSTIGGSNPTRSDIVIPTGTLSHNSMPGRSVPNVHPGTSIGIIPTPTVLSTNVEDAIKEINVNGGILASILGIDSALPGKFYGVQLPENHPELGIDHFSLICMRGGSQEELVQVAIGYDGTAQKLWLRGGEINSYGPFNQISGGGGTVDEVDPVFAAWLDTYTKELAVTKQGFNGEISPVVYPVDKERTIIGYRLGSNATDFSVTVDSVNYTKADITNVVVPVNTEITINDVTILTGNDTGNVVLILK